MTEAIDSINSVLLLLLRYLLILVISYILAASVFPSLLKLFNDAGLTKPNYRGIKTPATGGVLFMVMIPVITTMGMLFRVGSFTTQNCFLFMFVLVAMGFMGFFDDQLGVHEVKGFKGHFQLLFGEQKLTSGAFKAIFGAIIALVFSFGTMEFIRGGWPIWTFLINFLLVASATNTINLFDLRPGRAGKAYLFGFIVVLSFSGGNFLIYTSLFLPILAIMIYYLPFDLQGKVMMGDSGSNLLGASLGIMMAWMLSDVSKIVALVILLALQLIAEKFSFSEIIEEYRILRYLDELGRRKEH
jgi:UDP-N-acetylmuramyl pentapeptide phosphotransferase/UDP-N-acetylglucosamine-1-phosphate transferase